MILPLPKIINANIPTIGMGVLYNHENFYAGLSVPNLLGTNWPPVMICNYRNSTTVILGTASLWMFSIRL